MRPIGFSKITVQTIIRLSLCLGLVLVLVVGATILLLPKVVEHPLVQQKIKSSISAHLKGQLDFENFALFYRGGPHLVLHQGRWASAGANAKVASAILYPRLLPLLMGRFQLRQLRIAAPEAYLSLNTKPELKKIPDANLQDTKNIAAILTILHATAGSANVEVTNGLFAFVDQNRTIFGFSGITIQKAGRQKDVFMTARTNFSETFQMQASFDPVYQNTQGTISINGLKPHLLTPYFFPSAALHLTDSKMNLDINFKADRKGNVKASLTSNQATFTLSEKKRQYQFSIKKLIATYIFENGRQELAIDPFEFLSPRFVMSANLTASAPVQNKKPTITLMLTGNDIDVKTMRAIALDLFGDFRLTKKLVRILKSGHVKLLKIGLKGSSLKSLGEGPDNFELSGKIEEGQVLVPNIDWTLNKVYGDVTFKNNLLSGQNIRAHYGDLRGHNGTLRFDFKGQTPSLKIDTAYSTDIKQVPSLLRQLDKESPFSNISDRWAQIEGEAAGRFSLTGPVKNPILKITADKLKVSATHRQKPLRLEVRQASLHYDGKHLNISNLHGRLNKSSYNNITTSIELQIVPLIRSMTGKITVRLDDLKPHWISFPAAINTIGRLKSVRGTVPLEIHHLQGQLFNPKTWKFQASGRLQQVALDVEALPAPMIIDGAQFEARENGIDFKDTQVALKDSGLIVAGNLSGNAMRFDSGRLKIRGNVKAATAKWLARHIRLFPQIRLSAFEIDRAQIEWMPQTPTTWAGNLSFEQGLQISMKGSIDKNKLNIGKFDLKDHDSDVRAIMTFDRSTSGIDLYTNGRLNTDTLKHFWKAPLLAAGEFNGTLRLVYPPKPANLKLTGNLNGQKLKIVLPKKKIISIGRFHLNGNSDKIYIEADDFAWGDTRISTKGNLFIDDSGTRFELAVAADVIDGEHLLSLWSSPNQSAEQRPTATFLPKPINGKAEITVTSFHFKKAAWTSLEAQLRISPQATNIILTQAFLCGIATPGTLHFTPKGLQLAFKTTAVDQPLQDTFRCLGAKPNKTEGLFSLTGETKAVAKESNIHKVLEGGFNFDAGKGRIFGMGVLGKVFTKLFSALNITEIFVGRLPDLGREGFGFHAIEGRASLKNGRFYIDNLFIDGASMKLFGQGHIDLSTTEIDLTVLAAPIKTVDRIVALVPVLKHLFPQGVVAIPISISGGINEPVVRPLSPEAVGRGLLNFVHNTLTLPIKLIRRILPAGKDKKTPTSK
jgi:hypothetical protein